MKQNKYPYVVLRVMAVVYIDRKVRFVEVPEVPVNNAEIVIHCPSAFKRGRLTAEARRLLIEEVTARVVSKGYSQCIVFGPRSALYIESSGIAKVSRQPPGGGVRLKRDVVTKGGKSIMKSEKVKKQ